MEINIFYTENNWRGENPIPNETLEGEISVYREALIIKTQEEGKTYKQIISPDKIFAMTYRQPYAYYSSNKDIFIYLESSSWSNYSPECALKGELLIEESVGGFICINTADGYKQYISQNKIFSIVCEG